MEKQTTTKIILGLIIFIVFVFQVSSPIQAATSSMSNLYSNPNQSDNNTYKFKLSNIVNSNILTNVVGCTGIVNKVSTWMATLIQTPAQAAKILADKIEKGRALLKSACTTTKVTLETTAQSLPTMPGYVKPIDTGLSLVSGNVLGLMGDTAESNLLTPDQPGTSSSTPQQNEKICQDSVDMNSPKLLAEAATANEQQQADDFKTQCLDGIAITLAKNQLTSMTRSMMNWVNTGYGGNPFFVQNMQDLANNLERNVLETGIDILLSSDSGNSSPYAQDFASSALTSSNLLRSSSGLLGNLQSSLENFITDPKSFYTDPQLKRAYDTESALKKAQDANNAFANDFSIGGWNGWLALTQIDQNNPLGYTIQAAQELAAQQAAQVSQTQNELNQNNGFLSQKTCILWKVLDENGDTVWDTVHNKVKTTTIPGRTPAEKAACADWKIITPGSLIKDKVTNYINSPDRQLELAKTINDSLNALFSVLLSKLEGGGLAGLSDASTDATFNWTDNMNTTSDLTSSDGNSTYSNNGAYDGFNLTRDLGNTYIHTTPILLGTWDAKTNTTIKKTPDSTKPDPDYPPKDEANKKIKLYPDTAPEVYQVIDGGKTKLLNGLYGDIFNPTNGYYTVTTAGNTKLINEGYNGWAKGDRAFWDGSNWQNWKCYKSTTIDKSGLCDNQINPIKTRGVIQIQQDYIVAAQEILGVLPNVMPKLGELDYCIPGPNPSYQTNSADAQLAYQSWIGTIYTGPKDMTDMNKMELTIDREDSTTYKTLASIFSDNPNVWKTLSVSNAIAFFLNYFGDFTGTKWEGITSYFYKDAGADKFKEAQKMQTINANYVNNSLFQNFYDVFSRTMNKVYFKNMTSQYLNTEKSIGVKPNQDYIPMSTAGLDLIKDITYYNNDTAQKIHDYTNAVAQAKVNIAKLQPIKTEVSGIIKVAQDRQIANIITALKKLNGSDSYTPSASEIAKYRTDNKACLDEENIQVFDPDTITNGGTTENCSDGIDNDLNGLIDCADSVCKKESACLNTSGTSTSETRRPSNTSGTSTSETRRPSNTSGTSTSGTSTSETRRDATPTNTSGTSTSETRRP